MRGLELVDRQLLARYDRPGPRYTSYPTVPAWSADFGEREHRQALDRVRTRPQQDLCLYLHLPFCARRCDYCGCNALTACGRGAVDRYLDQVRSELELVTTVLGRGRRVVQIHWGGGTPNYLDESQLRRAMFLLREHFCIEAGAEISLEADPRLGSHEQALLLAELGFNRISLGVQDFDPEVQRAIGRRQPEEMTRRFFAACREAGFASINLDLVYGLPRQTPATLARTLAVVGELAPERIACFGYAHVPWARPNQQRVDTTGMPVGARKFALFEQALQTLGAAGYDWIGLDHFARPDDELALALRQRRLHRNFMGYTVRPAADLLALGMSGISELGGCFAQNAADLQEYGKRLEAGRLPIVRGHGLSREDALRRRVITHLMCNRELPWDLCEAEFGVRLDDPAGEFAADLERLEPLAADGLLEWTPERLVVTPTGRFFLRNICMAWDSYLERDGAGAEARPTFSRTV
jgi:oxygen-independent coproporphyrinogen-3 oxidase